MPDDARSAKWVLKLRPSTPGEKAARQAAREQAIAELDAFMARRRNAVRNGTARPPAQSNDSAIRHAFAQPDAPSASAGLPSDSAPEPEAKAGVKECDTEWLYQDPTDRFTVADRVFCRVNSGTRLIIRILAGALTVLAGCELLYAFDLMTFEAGSHGAILAAMIGCFAAARWITK